MDHNLANPPTRSSVLIFGERLGVMGWFGAIMLIGSFLMVYRMVQIKGRPAFEAGLAPLSGFRGSATKLTGGAEVG